MSHCLHLKISLTLLVLVGVFGRILRQHPGHLKPFGYGGPFVDINEMTGYPSAQRFFEDYVYRKSPLVMRGAAKSMKAFSKWTETYLQTINDGVKVEMSNDERSDPVEQVIPLSEYMGIYNDSSTYLISSVPHQLRQDVSVPCPLQCKKVMKELMAEDVMWLSNGKSKSAVHTDPAENVNCLLRGHKTFVLVDTEKHRRHKRAFGGDDFNIDMVDYERFSWMADIEFYVVNVTAGDCIYIPYLWYHQVRSFGNTMAVNLWWRHFDETGIDFSECNEHCNPSVTLLDCSFIGIQRLEAMPQEYIDYLLALFDGNQNGMFDRFSFHTYLRKGFGFDIASHRSDKLFTLANFNGDEYLTEEDIKQLSKETLIEIQHEIAASHRDKRNHDGGEF